jgi:hypothetical protein
VAQPGSEENEKRPGLPETEALVRMFLDGVGDPGPGDFVSKHTFAASDVVGRVRTIRWFAHCGEPRDFDLTMAVEQVTSWPQASRALKSRAWATATLEARNQLTAFLSEHHPERDRDWNDVTERFKRDVVIPLTESVWEPYRQRRKLDIKFVHSVEWNILAALMENAYMDCRHGCFFFHELLTVYEAGQLPCGWIGDWPQGKLIVY